MSIFWRFRVSGAAMAVKPNIIFSRLQTASTKTSIAWTESMTED